MTSDLRPLVHSFTSVYDSVGMDAIWADLSTTFRQFWHGRVMAPGADVISDDECDQVIRVLDRNGKGNTKASQAVARAMIPQGAWRRMFNKLHSDKELGAAVDKALTWSDPALKAQAIDEVYRLNHGERNYLSGGSGNAICAFLAAYDPAENLSIISLNDRRAILEHLGKGTLVDWDGPSIGTRIVETSRLIKEAARDWGLVGSARTLSRFFYFPQAKLLWKGQQTVDMPGRTVSVEVPTDRDDEAVLSMVNMATAAGAITGGAASRDVATLVAEEIRESMQIQALLAKIGTQMGYSIWLPRSDRSRVLKAWTPAPGELLDSLPLGYDASTTKTIEQIDVLWLRRRSIARAFEVEHTTSIYSGLLRMADLIALQPDINVRLHIVASEQRQRKVLEEINRPVFAMLERRPLREVCTFLSYDHIREISGLKHLARLSDGVLEDYAIEAEEGDDGL